MCIRDRRYGDLLLRVRPDMRQYQLLDHLLEFKALSLKTVRLTSAELMKKTREELRELPEIKASLQDAGQQLAAYRVILERPAGDSRPLHTHAIVCIGLERLVW